MTLSTRRARIVVAAILVFVATITLRATAASNADAVLTLNTIPVVMIAFEFGWRGGAIAAAIALAWVVAWHAITLSPLGYFSRGMTYFAAGLIVGTFADRLRAAQAAVVRSERRVAQLALEQQEQFQAAAIERERLARELHDVIAHSVSVMTVQSTAARRVIAEDPPRAATALEAIERTGREAMGEMRRMVSVLRPGARRRAARPAAGHRGPGGAGRADGGGRPGGEMRVEGEPPARPGGRRAVRVQDRAGGADEHAQACRPGAGRRVPALCAGHDRDRVQRPRRGPGARQLRTAATAWSGMRERATLLGGAVAAGPGPGRAVPGQGEAAAVIRVLIADDQQLVRSGFRMMLEAEGDIEVVAEAADGQEAVELTNELRPDVALLDLRMPRMDGIQATELISKGTPGGTRVLVVTTFDADEYVYAAIRAGASGFLLKDAPPEELAVGVRVIAAGEALLAPSVTRRLIEEFARIQPRQEQRDLEALTEREMEVLRRRRARTVERRDRAGARDRRDDGQDARRQRADEARPARPRAGGGRRLRVRGRAPRRQPRPRADSLLRPPT